MENIASPQSFIFSDDYICQWDSCLKNFDDAEMLYEHLRDEHVGRKAHHNLCLTCKWDKCSVPTFAKRDHITSHLRVHVASKPYLCDICRKGFKRPQDLKKHEKTHQENASSQDSNQLQPTREQSYQPLTPPSYLDRSPSIASSTVSAQSPYSLPMSPASMTDADSWINPGLSSPSCSTVSSDLYSSPARPSIDISAAYHGNGFGMAPSGYDDMATPMSAKRGFDEVLTDTLGSFALEAKKKRFDPTYNEDMMGRLNALSAIMEFSPLTVDSLQASLPDVNDMKQFSQFTDFCATLFEDVSGEVFEPEVFTPLFPDYEQKQNPATLNSTFGINNNNINNNINNNFGYPSAHLNQANNAFGTSSQSSSQNDSIYATVIPDDDDDDIFAPVSSMAFNAPSTMPWDTTNIGSTGIMPSVGVNNMLPARNLVQQPTNRFDPRYGVLINAQNSNYGPVIKIEPEEEFLEPKIEPKVERKFADMSTQTKAKQDRERYEAAADGLMMLQRPAKVTTKKPQQQTRPQYEETDPTLLMLSAPSVPDTPLPELDETTTSKEQDQDKNQHRDGHDTVNQQPTAQDTTASSKYESFVQKARARQAAAAAAAAAVSAPTATTEPLDPVEAMTRQLAQTSLGNGGEVKLVRKPPTTKPVTEGDMERQIRAAKARSLCSQDPVRKQHAEVVLNLLKSIDSLMSEHRQKVALWKAQESQAATARPHPSHAHGHGHVAGEHAKSVAGGPVYPRTSVNVQNQGQIRTVSSYLPRRGPAQSQQQQQHHQQQQQQQQPQPVANPDYNQLRTGLSENSHSYSASPAVVESTMLYPTSDLQAPVVTVEEDDEPFELSEEERRFIEEDNARIAAAKAASLGYNSVHV
ncbi:hypothetical protein BGZ94_009206 [Podila epigama]|nr:hypothetical protein BGZ94_009206 [Podila epigama]